MKLSLPGLGLTFYCHLRMSIQLSTCGRMINSITFSLNFPSADAAPQAAYRKETNSKLENGRTPNGQVLLRTPDLSCPKKRDTRVSE